MNMKRFKYLLILSVVMVSTSTMGQRLQDRIPKVYVNENVTTHFVLPEPIVFADISTDRVQGDQPEDNILRIKPVQDQTTFTRFQGVVTIVAQKFMVQFEMIYVPSIAMADKRKLVAQSEGVGLVNPEIGLSSAEMKSFCIEALQRKANCPSVRKKAYKMSIKLNNIWTVGDYYFLDLTFENGSRIGYTIDQIRFRIEDRKKVKRTNFQQMEIRPLFQLYDLTNFKRQYRNIFVFKKFTFPNEKVFTVELAEEQISGRHLILEIDYRDILNADTL